MSIDDWPANPPSTAPEIEGRSYCSEEFGAVLDQTFALQLKHGKSLALKLVAVENSKIDNPGYDGFSLYFAPPDGSPPLPDNSYFLENPTLGRIVMHLSATPANSGNAGDYEYEAVFVLRKT